MDIDGIVLIDKDEGLTSFEVVRKLRSRLGAKKAGHTGTLDKAASGLLIVCINRAVSVQSLFMSDYKRYRATISLGKETDTLDSYGTLVRQEEVEIYPEEVVRDVLKAFTGKILQKPPLFSAVHQNGERLYRKALRGERPSIEPRTVEIRELTLLGLERREITIDTLVSKGTYIRSLARDISHSLGTCGYLSRLRRLEIGPFSVSEAIGLNEVVSSCSVIPLNEGLGHFPQCSVTLDKAKLIINGVSLEKIFPGEDGLPKEDGFFRVLFKKRLIAIIRKGDTLQYFKVFGDLEVVHS